MAAADEATFASLPPGVALSVFGRLSLWERLRCEEVCKSWHALLAGDASLWTHLELTPADGGACTEELLHGAAARARNRVHSLRLAFEGVDEGEPDLFHDALCVVAADNAATLRELRMAPVARDWAAAPWGAHQGCEQLEALLRAAPQLRVLEAAAHCEDAHAARLLLRNEPPFGPLRLLSFSASDYAIEDDDGFFALAANPSLHASLRSLALNGVSLRSAAARDAVVDAALARRVTRVTLAFCSLGPAAVPALARLLRGNALTELLLQSNAHEEPLLDYAAAAALGAALRDNTSLTSLTLQGVALWADHAAAVVLLASLQAHPSLRCLRLALNPADMLGAALLRTRGEALAALLLADSPALETLECDYWHLRDEGLAPVLQALRYNTHLRALDCRGNEMSEACAADVLLPAVRANTSLRELHAQVVYGRSQAILEAVAIAAARARAP
jgi:hypothetical protein